MREFNRGKSNLGTLSGGTTIPPHAISVVSQIYIVQTMYRRPSISGTTFGGEKCLSGTIFNAV
jgi:hypothetical protein